MLGKGAATDSLTFIKGGLIMKKFLMFLCSSLLVIGSVGLASADLITVDLDQAPDVGYGSGTLTYSNYDTSFTGSLTVDGLTEGMTYQMKLEGLNNTNLGSIGRWWVVNPDDPTGWGGHSATDATYEAEMQNYPVKGYLLFDSFVYSGPTTINFYADSSYHVAGVPQSDRPAPGEVIMPSGLYENVTFLLTEDGAPYNNALIRTDVTFTVSDNAPVPEPSTLLLMGAGILGLVGYNRKRFSKRA